MSKTTPVGLLRLIYKSVDWSHFRRIAPSVERKEADALFSYVAEHLPLLLPAGEDKPAETKTDSAVISTDGASKGNPGPAGIGALISDSDGNEIDSISRYIGERTNNQAEYEAVIAALERAAVLGIRDIVIRTDSKLLAKQITGAYRVKNPGIKVLHDKVMNLLVRFERWRAVNVPREQNRAADRLANEGVRKGRKK